MFSPQNIRIILHQYVGDEIILKYTDIITVHYFSPHLNSYRVNCRNES